MKLHGGEGQGSPLAWIAALGGQGALDHSYREWPSLAVGRFRFDEAPELRDAPRLDWHYISLTLAGPVEVEGMLDGARVRARQGRGQLILMSAGQTNAWRWDPHTEEVHLFLHPAAVAEAAREAGCGAVEFPTRFAVEDPAIRRTALVLADELRQPGVGGALLAASAAQFLALSLIRRHCGTRRTARRPSALSPGQRQRLEAYVDAHLADEITLQVLAGLVGLSTFHFARAFKATVGMAPHDWLIGQRMARARTLLAESRLSVLEVAHRTGFQSQSHFGLVFRRRTGCTPLQWRRRTAR